jgi:acetolactate synthase-1/2/3 large subunit
VQFDGPAFLEVMVDPEACVYPMVGPGMGYKEMITGDFIVGRTPDDSIHDERTKPPTDSF